jgi:hypothetical protein
MSFEWAVSYRKTNIAPFKVNGNSLPNNESQK